MTCFALLLERFEKSEQVEEVGKNEDLHDAAHLFVVLTTPSSVSLSEAGITRFARYLDAT
jgi:hypothetical protein